MDFIYTLVGAGIVLIGSGLSVSDWPPRRIVSLLVLGALVLIQGIHEQRAESALASSRARDSARLETTQASVVATERDLAAARTALATVEQSLHSCRSYATVVARCRSKPECNSFLKNYLDATWSIEQDCEDEPTALDGSPFDGCQQGPYVLDGKNVDLVPMHEAPLPPSRGDEWIFKMKISGGDTINSYKCKCRMRSLEIFGMPPPITPT